MTKDKELELAKQFRDSLPKDSYLWDLVNEAIPYWDEFMRTDGFYNSLGGLYDRKKELELELNELSKKRDLINKELDRLKNIYFKNRDSIKRMVDCFYDLRDKSINTENLFIQLEDK